MAKKAPQSATGTDHTKLNPKIMGCTCDHEFQDRKYGRKRRLHNPGKDKYRCTVCGNEKS